ncbi:hypothetical protein [Actinomadura sp. B10D3]|uniref:hypothetical protein n=1 Tax=Actinomadura sp. B10D3 TaxID=3153557 RepID=UPI00325C3510
MRGLADPRHPAGGPGRAALDVRLIAPLPDEEPVHEEAARLLGFAAPGDEHDLRIGLS